MLKSDKETSQKSLKLNISFEWTDYQVNYRIITTHGDIIEISLKKTSLFRFPMLDLLYKVTIRKIPLKLIQKLLFKRTRASDIGQW